MTTPPEATWQPPDDNPFVSPPAGGWGAAPPAQARPWYKAPGSVAGAATFSACAAWTTIVTILCGWVLVHHVHPRSIFDFVFVLVFVGVLLILLVVAGTVAFWMTVMGAIATLPLAVAWWRSGDRSAPATAALANAAAAWALLALLVGRLGLVHTVL